MCVWGGGEKREESRCLICSGAAAAVCVWGVCVCGEREKRSPGV